jgi:transcriptional regulator GlxA family with amidase domain
MPNPRRVAILLYPGVQSLDIVGPLEVFAGAQTLIEQSGRRDRGYVVETVARTRGPVASSSGLELVAKRELSDLDGPLDTLIVPGGGGSRLAAKDDELLAWIRAGARRARRVASVCTGAFPLAATGLLDGRRVTTHWASAAALARAYPRLNVDPDPIYIREGRFWTSAGVSAGMDLALALVEDDLDRAAALEIARHLVLFLRRPGGQSQFSALLAGQQPAREPLREIQREVVEDPAARHSVEAMAERAHMSPRHFARAFAAETGITPGRFVERVRLDAARRLLEDSEESLGAIASGCGFGTPETMRRSFLRVLSVGPLEYRRRFRPAQTEAA